jgi:protein tyrosine/serine phosphatase
MADTQFHRHLSWDACYNARDLGGYDTNAGAQTRWRSLIRADGLFRLTPAGREALLDYGIRTIIDLRSGHEVKKNPNPFADGACPENIITHMNLPALDESDSEGMAGLNAADTPRENYIFMLSRFRRNFAAIFRAIAEAGPGGIVVHCHAGKDRTGLVSALLLALAGVPSETIAADYALTDAYLQPHYDEIRANNADPDPAKRERLEQWLVSPPETMLAVLSHLDRQYGGVRAYLLSAGLTPGELNRVRSRLRE